MHRCPSTQAHLAAPLRTAVIAALAVLAMAGCGNTGPLYLPETTTVTATIDPAASGDDEAAALNTPDDEEDDGDSEDD